MTILEDKFVHDCLFLHIYVSQVYWLFNLAEAKTVNLFNLVSSTLRASQKYFHCNSYSVNGM